MSQPMPLFDSMSIQAGSDMTPQAVMDHHAKSFSWAARFLSSAARKDAALLYAFARTADDYADEERLGTVPERLQYLADMRVQALAPGLPNLAQAPACAPGSAPLARATGQMLRNYAVPDAVLECFMDSLQTDAGPRAIANQQELLRFAYGVAGTVGQMMRPLLGAPGAADSYAIALGVAMQLTNIARDVVEDAQRGRCYIPAEWGVASQVLAAPQSASQRAEAFAVLRQLLALADDFYAYAQSGIQAIPAPNRRAIRIATTLYQAIGHKIVQRGPDKYWQGRTSLGAAEKSWLIARTLLNSPAAVQPARDVWRSDLSHLADTPGFPA
jgi:15-cis-phytoene synthase